MRVLYFIILYTINFQYQVDIPDIKLSYHWEAENELHLSIRNTSVDSVYLFDSYIDDDFSSNKYFRRFDHTQSENKLSFLPLVKYLDLVKSDRIIIGENKVVSQYQIAWSLQSIPPKSEVKIIFGDSWFKNQEYVYEDFDVKTFVNRENLNSINSSKIQSDSLKIELAFYNKDVAQYLILKKDAPFKESDFERAELSFRVKSVLIPIK